MRLQHSFTLPSGIDESWRVLVDIGDTAGRVPGATVAAVDGDVVTGSFKMKLGSINPTYKGTATVLEKDEEAHRVVVSASGQARGNGSISARITVALSQVDAATVVDVVTELEFSGRPAAVQESVVVEALNKVVRGIRPHARIRPKPEAVDAVPDSALSPAEPGFVDVPEVDVPEVDVPEVDVPADGAPESAIVQPRVGTNPPQPAGVTPSGRSRQRIAAILIVLVLVLARRRRRRRRAGQP